MGYGEPRADITWMYNGQAVMNSSLVSITEEEFTEEGLLFKRSSLQICNAKIRNSGNYTCFVSNGLDSVTASTQLTLAGKMSAGLVGGGLGGGRGEAA